MKKVLIIYPHFPPSNLAGVHRPRLFANHLSAFGWQPVILTVHEKFYEESPDWELVKLLPLNLRIVKGNALPIVKPRIVGDIGLRGFWNLYQEAVQLIRKEKFDFLFIPIPSFYTALLGRLLHKRTAIPYGIDYIDPWVHHFPGAEAIFSRAWFATKIAAFLEPIAVKQASLITGVAEAYYLPVLQRNPKLKVVHGAMPYGWERLDHIMSTGDDGFLFEKKEGKIQLVYAGAFLPKSLPIINALFKAIGVDADLKSDIEIHFIGTGKNKVGQESIRDIANRYGIYGDIVFEYPDRISYTDVIKNLRNSDGIIIIGTTEPHYTPSKIFQAILSEKPVLAILHHESTAIPILKNSHCGLVYTFHKNDVAKIFIDFKSLWFKYKNFLHDFKPAQIDWEYMEPFSAKSSTQKLVNLINKAIN